MTWIFTGFHLAGKTTFGKRLSVLTQLPFFDLDWMIEKRVGKGVRDFVKQEGNLDRLERWAIGEVSQIKRGVISLGGGTILCPEKASALGLLGTIVYLRVPFETIWERIDLNDLPTFCDRAKPKESLLDLFNQRDPIYRARSDFVLEYG